MTDAPASGQSPSSPPAAQASAAGSSSSARQQGAAFPARTSDVRARPITDSSPDDLRAINALSAAGLTAELTGGELKSLSGKLSSDDPTSRVLDLLDLYYAADGDAEKAERRVKADRFFVHRSSDEVSARRLVERLAAVAPELENLTLDRIGGDEGPLVLRSGDHVAGIEDDSEESNGAAAPTITVRGLVHAINVLFDRVGVRERLIEIMGDDAREAYVATSLSHAMTLCQEDLLEEEDPAALMEQASW